MQGNNLAKVDYSVDKRPSSEIDRQLDVLRTAFEALAVQIDTLRLRLEPVMRTPTPAMSEPAAVPPPREAAQSPLGGTLDGLARELEGRHEEVAEIVRALRV